MPPPNKVARQSDSRPAAKNLVNYDSSSSSDDENDLNVATIASTTKNYKRLPSASKLLATVKGVQIEEQVIDDPSKHGGRLRTFKHVRGNWATFVYVPVQDPIMLEIQNSCCKLLSHVPNLHCSTDLHVSLSQTVVMGFHMIEPYVASLKQALCGIVGFQAAFYGLKVYCNEQRTRTFLAFRLDERYVEKFNEMKNRVDVVMQEYKLNLFYENPCFHCSFLWCTGDQEKLLNLHLTELHEAIVKVNDGELIQILLKEVRCKSGNRDYSLKLS